MVSIWAINLSMVWKWRGRSWGKSTSKCVEICEYINLLLSRFVDRVFSQKHSSTFVVNVGIYNVDNESVYQIGQSGKIKCFVSVSWEGLTRELLMKHNYLYLSWLFAFQSCARHMHHFAGCLFASYQRKLFSLQFDCVFTFSLSHTILTIKSHNKYRVQKIE